MDIIMAIGDMWPHTEQNNSKCREYDRKRNSFFASCAQSSRNVGIKTGNGSVIQQRTKWRWVIPRLSEHRVFEEAFPRQQPAT